MAIIFPGNYVERLNAYSTTASNRQGVEALPGLNFFSAVGVVIVPAAGLALATNPCDTFKVLSPDMRADDKPRLDKDLAIPKNATVYRVAIRGVNVKGAAASGEACEPVIASSGTQFQNNLIASMTSAASPYNYTSDVTEFRGLDVSATGGQILSTSADTTIYLKHAAALAVQDADDIAAVICEVCYYLDGDAPDSDSVNLPFKTETGSS